MPRPKNPVETSVNFHARITPGEGRAVEALVAKHAEELAKLGAPGGANAWFRAVVRRLASEAGVAIVDDMPAAVAPISAPIVKRGK